MTDDEFRGQAGVITGGGSGIGAATAMELARLGHRVLVADLSLAAATEVAERVRAAGGAATPFACDVRRFADLERLRDACLAAFGRLDFIVVSAGIADASSLAEGDPERWRAVIETNVLGAAYTVRAVLPTMLAQNNGHIVLLASVSGREIYVGEPVYIASKWAVVGLGGALRKEVAGTGIRVTLIEPGIVDTPLARANPFAQEWLNSIAPLQAEDVARAIGFALQQPGHMAINEIVLRPLAQEV